MVQLQESETRVPTSALVAISEATTLGWQTHFQYTPVCWSLNFDLKLRVEKQEIT